jgi:hypothetical protein
MSDRGRATDSEDDAALATLEEAEAALARAKAELETALLTDRDKAKGGEGAPATGAPARRRPARAEESEAKSAQAQKTVSPCANACRAFASLERAAAAVCRLAGDANERCSRARRVVADSEERVTTCRCQR